MRRSSTRPSDEFMVETYKLLVSKWRDVAEEVAKACAELCGDCEVYVIGSVARGTATALSDLDVLIVLPENCNAREIKKKLLRKVIWRIPFDYPLNLHAAVRGSESRMLKKGFIKIK
ncbi:MAG: nucleotidyltransferase domain-containing protein [Crenarchaeota archaeon]|nr:nucleotidyltransferase domain-containing protein [Thermoproteota archaeon]